MPESKSAFDTPWFRSQSNDFFNQLNKPKVPRIVITAETEDFDEAITQQFKDEGFDTVYVPFLNGGNEFVNRVHSMGDSSGVGECYAIVAFRDAASIMLEANTKPSNPRLVALVAYYPSIIPAINTRFPPGVGVLVHLAGSEVGVLLTPQVLGIQSSKKKTVQKRIDPGEGHGGGLKLAYQAYTYQGSEPGFAERDLEEYDPIAESIAFTRSLATLRKAFKIETAIESVRDEFVSATISGDHDKTQKTLRPYAHAILGPTLTGGIGTKDISRFYSRFFSPLPASFSSRLISRTIGTDRVVDELFIGFKHTTQIAWMLPGIPPTNKNVEIVIVSIVCVRGGRLESEHLYWDQASVLAQIGLIDPRIAPVAMKQKGVKLLPIVGAEGARALKRGSSREMNGLIPEWYSCL